jgi:hypothetical protein
MAQPVAVVDIFVAQRDRGDAVSDERADTVDLHSALRVGRFRAFFQLRAAFFMPCGQDRRIAGNNWPREC